jgi:hypothetical protein
MFNKLLFTVIMFSLKHVDFVINLIFCKSKLIANTCCEFFFKSMVLIVELLQKHFAKVI